ncbi:MAG: hypothetical protein WDM88_01555 [Galbitalea sp.]
MSGALSLLSLIDAFGYGKQLNWVGLLLYKPSARSRPSMRRCSLSDVHGSQGVVGTSPFARGTVLAVAGLYIAEGLTSFQYDLASKASDFSAGLLAAIAGLLLVISLVIVGILVIRAKVAGLLAGLALILLGILEGLSTLIWITYFPVAPNITFRCQLRNRLSARGRRLHLRQEGEGLTARPGQVQGDRCARRSR